MPKGLSGLSMVLLLLWPAVAAAQQERRGDFAVGYAVTRAAINLPVGITISNAWQINPKVDVVVEGQFSHGSGQEDFGLSMYGVMGGPRLSTPRRDRRITISAQVLLGLIGTRATQGDSSGGGDGCISGLGIQPGFGFEIPVNPKIALRPQFDLPVGRFSGDNSVVAWTNDQRFNVSVVFTLFP